MNDTKRLDWLEANGDGVGIINDDFGHWAVSWNGMQNVPRETPAAITTTHFIAKNEWHNTIRDAIDAAIEEQEKP